MSTHVSDVLRSNKRCSAIAAAMVVSSLFAIAFSLFILTAGTVHAGSNGQQLLLANACADPQILTWVKVTGANQQGQKAVWQSQPNKSSVMTSGWWWKGKVVVEWRTNREPYSHTTADIVPISYQRDYWVILLDKWGCQ